MSQWQGMVLNVRPHKHSGSNKSYLEIQTTSMTLQWLTNYVTSLWSMHVSSISNQMFLLSLGGPSKTRSCSCSTWLMLQSTVSFMMLLKFLLYIQHFSIVLMLYCYKCIKHNGKSTGPVFVHYSYSTTYVTFVLAHKKTHFLSWNHHRTLSILDIILQKIIIVQPMSIND